MGWKSRFGRAVCALLVCTAAAGCGDNNVKPYLGKWGATSGTSRVVCKGMGDDDRSRGYKGLFVEITEKDGLLTASTEEGCTWQIQVADGAARKVEEDQPVCERPYPSGVAKLTLESFKAAVTPTGRLKLHRVTHTDVVGNDGKIDRTCTITDRYEAENGVVLEPDMRAAEAGGSVREQNAAEPTK